jgi:pimeloyl-ACP methyl ester carboxylesterase
MTKVDPPCSAQPTLAGVQAYQPQVADRSEWHPVRGLQMHVRRWRTDGADPAPLVMLHGWMDCSASYQFIVDHLHGAWELFAPDWRGFGLSDRTPADTYWFPDYLGDLDQLLDRIAPGQPVNLLAHSMGGNIAMMYAGVRPERVRRVINLEGLGLRATRPAQAPRRYQRWLDELRRDTPRSGRPYPSLAAVAERLMQSGSMDRVRSSWPRTGRGCARMASARCSATRCTSWSIRCFTACPRCWLAGAVSRQMCCG